MVAGHDGAVRHGAALSIPEVREVDEAAAERARARWDALAKPTGSLGRLEELGIRLAAIARRSPAPPPDPAMLIVCAGDHGIVARGASAWPSEVTAAMAETICGGRAAANAIAEVAGCDVRLLDVGIASPVQDSPRLIRSRIRPGTADVGREPAMSPQQAAAAVAAGVRAAREAVDDGGRAVLCGDMGIGNTTSAACLIAAMTGADPRDVTGAGAGGGPAHVARKVGLVREALALHRPDATEPMAVLAALGGVEHAALAGVILGGAAAGVPVLLDGVSTVAAALVAVALRPAAAGYLIASHRSTEPGATVGLGALDLSPVLDMEMRLGEGTGALLVLPIVRAAAAAHAGMARLDEVTAPA